MARQLDPYGPIPVGAQEELNRQEEEIGRWTDEQMLKGRGEKRHYGPGPHDNGTPQTVHGDREGSSRELEREAEAGGFSYRRIAGAPADGFMVSPYKQAERKYSLITFNHEDVARYRERQRELLAKPDHYLGGWRDGDVIYLDVSIRAADRSAAAVLARQHQQLAVFDLATGNVIPTEDLAA